MFLTAAVRALRKQHPNVNLSLATSTATRPFMEDTGLFEQVYAPSDVYDAAPFDVDVDLRLWVEAHPRRAQTNRMEQFADGLGVSCGGDYQMVCRPHSEDVPELEGVVHPL
jgi:hypothetical protein